MKAFLHFLLYVLTSLFFIVTSLKISWIAALFISLAVIGYGAYRINQNKYNMTAVMSIGMIMNSLFYFLAVHLSSTFKPLGLIITIGGAVFSFVVMFFYFFWKEGKKRVEFVVKHERIDTKEKITLKARLVNLRELIKDLKHIHARAKVIHAEGQSKKFSYQLAYVELKRKQAWKAPKNAIDFAILKEVELIRNEYSGEDGKRRSL